MTLCGKALNSIIGSHTYIDEREKLPHSWKGKADVEGKTL